MFLGLVSARPLIFDVDAESLNKVGRSVQVPRALITDRVNGLKPLKRPIIVDAMIPADHLLERRINVPNTKSTDFPKLATLDLARKTPFGSNDVNWTLSEPERTGDRVILTQWVARRSDVAGLRERLHRLGLVVRQVRLIDHAKALPLADYTKEIDNGRVWRVLNSGLATIALAAMVGIWAWPGLVASRDLEALEAELTTLRGDAVAARQRVEGLRAEEVERVAYLAAVNAGPQLSGLLRDLTIALPDGTYLTDMNITPVRTTLTGETDTSAADIVLRLSQNDAFGNPRTSGPVQRTGLGERFQIVFDRAVSP
ncbi:PilN domain-containing protein [Jannaschia pohangensis]|uniref:General secretion pathway protein L n=1 Tax=Jannaschia pohangensis TaxID=390807 RepID=A0A1I3JZ33_9RHOB|nr:PilN domain-containing protein [Jannaschia pohangensis]SFI65463.1 hypothetical protein SAMN04488095_1480 [Jannaschia pohangensis]